MIRKLPVLLACALYLASFFLPAWVHEDGKTDLGYEVFVLSFKCLLFGFPIWLANPTFWIGAWRAFRARWKEASCWGVGNFLILVLYLPPTLSSLGRSRLSVGFYFWLSSTAVRFLLSSVQLLKEKSARRMVLQSLCTSGSAVVMGMVAFGNVYWLLLRCLT